MKKVRFLLMSLLSIVSYGQITNIDNFKLNNAYPSTTTPEKASLMRFDQFPNIEAIGGTQINIPIYNIEIDGLEIPISLVYNTKGIKVADIASNIGLGWSLTGDGSIEYQINDLHDFEYMDGVRDGGFDNQSGEYFNVMSGFLMPNRLLGERRDISPDFYIMNAPGIKNKFYLKKDLSVCPSGDCMEINENQFIPNFFEKELVKSYDIIKLTNTNGGTGMPTVWSGFFKDFNFVTKLGFRYKFSDPISIYTSNFVATGLNDWPSSTNTNFTNWKLSQIVSPHSSKTVNYFYEDYTNSYNHPELLRNNGYDFGKDLMIGNIGTGGGGASIHYNTRSTTRYTNTKRLKKIASSGLEIIFNYDENRIDYAGGRLSSIQVKDIFTGKVIRNFSFYHSYFLPNETCNDNFNCYRLRLDKIEDSGSGNYIFKYGEGNSDHKFPKRSSSKVDFAGYFNNNASNIEIYSDYEAIHTNIPYTHGYYPMGKVYYYPELTTDNYIPFSLLNQIPATTYGSIDLTPNSQSLIGLLTDITYPTGGALKINYENDQFNYLNADYLLGSARIKKMEFFDKNNIVKSINYDYKLDNGFSSGLIAGFIPPSNNGAYGIIAGLELINNNTVIYSKVTEKVENKGKTEYYYSNYDEYPNVQGELSFGCYNNSAAICNAMKKQLQDLKYPYINIYKPDQRRANLVRKKIFDNNNNILVESEIVYENTHYEDLSIFTEFNRRAPSNDPFNFPGPLVFNGGRLNKLYTYSNNVKREITKEYSNSSFIKTEKEYTYDINRNLLKKLDLIYPLETITKSINYAEDKNNDLLVNANMVGIPLEVETRKNGKTISKTETKYENLYPSELFPSSVISYDLQNNSPGTEVTYDMYLYGNLQQYTTKEGVPVTLVWGYNNTKVIAKIEGIDWAHAYTTVMVTATAKSDLDVDAASEQTLITALDNIRKNPTFLNTQVTTYTYDPLIGVTSITPPSGIREVYLYDAANRLKEVRQDNAGGKLLKEFKYNYKN